jgi:DegV family protein with EDD domain
MDIDYVETSYMLDSEYHSAFDSQDVSLPEFYKILDKVKSCSTGCVNVQTFEDIFDKYAKQGIQVLYMGLSSGLSSTFSNAKIASDNINSKYDNKLIYLVDSKTASFGSLLLIETAKDYINEGLEMPQIVEKLEDVVKNMTTAFVARDLNFLHKCGRLSLVEAGLGKLLRIVPIIYANDEGKLKVGDKCLGTKLAYKTLRNRLIDGIKKKNQTKCYITSCGLDDDAWALKDFILKNTTITDVKVGYIDKTLACCCGPKTLAVFCG